MNDCNDLKPIVFNENVRALYMLSPHTICLSPNTEDVVVVIVW
jgi:hypothetical protein